MKALFLTDAHASEDALAWVARRGSGCGYDAMIIGGYLARGRAQHYVVRFLSAAISIGSVVFFVPGNADAIEKPVPEGVVALHGRTAKLGRYSIGGLGGSSPTPSKTPFELRDDDARAILERLGHVDILVSHCPPVNTKCDKIPSGRVGSLPVREYVEQEKPVLVLSEHAPGSRAIERLGESTLVNAGPVMDGNFAEVHLDGIVSVEPKAESLRG